MSSSKVSQVLNKNTGLIITVIFQLILAYLITSIFLLYNNSLEDDGNWESRKLAMGKEVMGSESYMETHHAVAYGRLNLGAWHGFQEVYYKNELDNVTNLSLDFKLKHGTYINVIFNKTKDGCSGIRFSADKLFPNQFFEASNEGEFLEKTQLESPLISPNMWHHIDIKFLKDELIVSVDDEKFADLNTPVMKTQKIGFRGSELHTFVDNIKIYSGNNILLNEDFSNNIYNKYFVFLIAFLLVLLVNALLSGILWLFAKYRKRKHFEYSMIIFNIFSLFICLIVYSLGDTYLSIPFLLKNEERNWLDDQITKIMKENEEKYLIPGMENDSTYRILFVGASQTWGSGAEKKDETFVAKTEEFLNNHYKEQNEHFVCIDMGVPAINSPIIVGVWEKWKWFRFQPDKIIINLSVNEDSRENFRVSLKKMIDMCRENGIEPVLSVEPHSIEHQKDWLDENHEVVRSVGKEMNVPVIDMQKYLEKHYDDGFLWWDNVHMTSFGYHIFAEKITKELIHNYLPKKMKQN